MPQKPNLLFLMPDQLRADFLSCYGADFIQTPHIDSLADHGVLYENTRTPAPICVPARATLLTGQNPIKTGVLTNDQFLRPDLAACGIHTWPEHLCNAGYHTAAIGKMHFYPWDIHLGFQDRVISEDKRWLLIEDDYHHFLKQHGYRKLHGDEHEGYHENKGAIVNRIPWEYSWDHFVGKEACDYIRAYDKDQPFAMMVGFPGPHCPYDPNLEFLEEFDPETMPEPIPDEPVHISVLRQKHIDSNKLPWNGVDYTEFTTAQKKKVRAHYAALVKQIDHEVGTILETLRETGQLDNTIILFASDHGDHLGDRSLIGKSDFYESSIKVPLIIQHPEMPERTTCTAPVSIEDITATLLQLGGCDVPQYMDSIPLPELGLTVAKPREYVFGFLAYGSMIFDGEWKLTKYTTGDILLFNLKDDPTEQNNRINDPACQEMYHHLDTALTTEMLQSIHEAHADKRVAPHHLYNRSEFGQKDWQRTYPLPL